MMMAQAIQQVTALTVATVFKVVFRFVTRSNWKLGECGRYITGCSDRCNKYILIRLI